MTQWIAVLVLLGGHRDFNKSIEKFLFGIEIAGVIVIHGHESLISRALFLETRSGCIHSIIP